MNKKQIEEVWQMYNKAEANNDTTLMNAIKSWHPKLFLQIGKWYEEPQHEHPGLPCKLVACFQGDYGRDNHFGFNRSGKYSNNLHITKGLIYRELHGSEVCRLLGLEAKRRGYLKHIEDGFFDFNDEDNTLTLRSGEDTWTLFKDFKWSELNIDEIKVTKHDDLTDAIIVAQDNFKQSLNDAMFALSAAMNGKQLKRWYISNCGTGVKYFVNDTDAFGFRKEEDGTWKWYDQMWIGSLNCDCCAWELASSDLVKKLIEEEAIKRGFKQGARFKCASDPKDIIGIIVTCGPEIEWYDNECCFPLQQCNFIMINGVWGELQKPINKPFHWYQNRHGAFAYFVSETEAFGFTRHGIWFDKINALNLQNDTWTTTSKNKVAPLLRKEAERRGFVAGKSFIPAEDGPKHRVIRISGALEVDNNPNAQITAIHHQNGYIMVNGVWADLHKLPIRAWYKNADGSMMYFVKENTAFGFTRKGHWLGKHERASLNAHGQTWQKMENDEIVHNLMHYATDKYSFGDEVKSAYNGYQGKVGRIVVARTRSDFDLLSSSNPKYGVRLFNATTGKWAKKV